MSGYNKDNKQKVNEESEEKDAIFYWVVWET